MLKVQVIIIGCRWAIASLMMTPINVLNGSLLISLRPCPAPQVLQLSPLFTEAQLKSDLWCIYQTQLVFGHVLLNPCA
jgi:hypothetical protein